MRNTLLEGFVMYLLFYKIALQNVTYHFYDSVKAFDWGYAL